jgi:ADP-ribosylglycohydrolase
MIGAITGDIIGSVNEHRPIKTTRFPLLTAESRFTDDTVLTVAVAAAILDKRDYGEVIVDFATRYPRAGYGRSFKQWVQSWEHEPYGSCGNGSAMRVSPVGFAFNTVASVLREAKRSAQVTHNHPEGIKGAQATALAIFLARTGKTKNQIKKELISRFGYDLERKLDDIRPAYSFDVTCQGSVPESIIAFLESDSYEGAVRNAVSLGGDADTQACIAGGIAQAFYGEIQQELVREVLGKLPAEFIGIWDRFREKYGVRA